MQRLYTRAKVWKRSGNKPTLSAPLTRQLAGRYPAWQHCKLTSTTRIKAGYGAGFALLLGTCFAAIRQTTQWEESAQAVARADQVIQQLEGLSLQSADAEAAARRFIVTPGVLELARCRRSLRQALAREKELEALVADSESERRNVRALRRVVGQQAETILRSLPDSGATGAAAAGNPEDVRRALAALDSAGLSAKLRSVIRGMEAEENRVLGERTVRQERALVVSRVLFFVASTISLILIVVAAWRIRSEQKNRDAARRNPASR